MIIWTDGTIMSRSEISGIQDPDLRCIMQAMSLIEAELPWAWKATSYLRADNPAHAEGRAVDFAARSGPLWERRKRGICPLYHVAQSPLKVLADRELARRIMHACPLLHLILIEPDHLHIETSHHDRPRRLDIVRYAARPNVLCPTGERVQTMVQSLEY